MPNRRQFIRGVTATAAFSGIGVVSASKPEKDDIASKIVHAYARGGPDQVERLLERNGIAYDQSTKKVSPSDSEKNDSEVGIAANHYSESDSEINLVLSEQPEHNRILCTANMKLGGTDESMRSPTWVPDVIGVGFDENVWTTVGTPTVTSVANSNKSIHDAEFWPGSIDGGGVAAQVDLEWGPNGGGLPSTSYISLQCELQTNGTPGTIWGSYKHTWSYVPIGGIEDITGGGALGVQIKNGSVLWDDMVPEDPERSLP